MPKYAYITVFLSIIILLLYGCGSNPHYSTNDISQFQGKIINNKYLKKYYTISTSGNIQEELQLNIQGQNDNSSFSLDISSSSYKNIFSGTQDGLYSFQMTTEDKTFAETEIVSGIVHIISKNKEYFIKPQNIIFIGPKGRITNQEVENKISEINNKRIKIDKEIPFTSTSDSIFSIQTFLNQLYTEQIQIDSNDSGKVEITGVDSDFPINSNISYKNGILYQSGTKQLQMTKSSPRKFGLIFFGKNRNIQSDIRIRKGRKNLTVNFGGSLVNTIAQNTTEENKLDIKGKYIIKSTGYLQVEIPNDYLNFTQTSLIKK